MIPPLVIGLVGGFGVTGALYYWAQRTNADKVGLELLRASTFKYHAIADSLPTLRQGGPRHAEQAGDHHHLVHQLLAGRLRSISYPLH